MPELQKEYKIELYKETEAEFAFLNKNIFCNYMHSRSPGLHGVARKVMVIDEIARFDSTEGPRSAAKVYEAATTTTQSFRRHGIRACISAPEHATDMICERYAYAGVKFESPELAKIYTPLREIDGREIIPEPHTIGFHYATWELNPTQTWEVLEPLRNSDPDSFWKIFGAIPPAAREPYFMNVELVKRAFSADIPTPWDAYGRLRDDFRGNPRLRYVMHLDPGLGRPSRFGIAIGHAEPHPKPPSETETTLYVIDFVYAVEPDPETREISFERVYELIEELLNRFEVVVATTDRWNDVHLRQYLAKYVRTTTIDADHIEGLKNRAPKILQGVLNRVVSPEDYEILKKVIYRGCLQCYYYDLVVEELLHLEYVNGKPEKGVHATKDVADCVASVVAQLSYRSGQQRAIGMNAPSIYGPRQNYIAPIVTSPYTMHKGRGELPYELIPVPDKRKPEEKPRKTKSGRAIGFAARGIYSRPHGYYSLGPE